MQMSYLATIVTLSNTMQYDPISCIQFLLCYKYIPRLQFMLKLYIKIIAVVIISLAHRTTHQCEVGSERVNTLTAVAKLAN